MALIYDPGPRKGIDLDQMVVEELVLVTRADLPLRVAADGSVQVLRLSELELLLPSPDHTVRQTVQNAVMEAGGSLHVVAETESARTAVRAARAGLGSTILPASVADALPDRTDLAFHRLSDPVVVVTVSLCTSDIHPLTEAAAAVRDIFVELIQQFAVHRKLHGPALG
jgi:LysR family nitrogen assimilation transcriptional regulator